jgi:hypothetical protein
MEMDEDELAAQFEDELLALVQEKPYVELMIRPQDAWIMLSFLQLALRHPEAVQHDSSIHARRIAMRLQELIAPPGSIMEEIANRGWNGE